MRILRPTRHATLLAMLLWTGAAIAQPPPPPPPLTPLPPPPVPAGNPRTAVKASLGKALFWDEQLSSTRTVACGSCHQPARGGSDPRSLRGSAAATNPGFDGVAGTDDDVTGSPGVVLNEASGAMAWSNAFGLQPQVTGRLAPSHVNAAYAPQSFWDGRAGQSYSDPVTGALVLPAGGALENQASGPPVSTGEMGHLGRDWTDVAARVAAARPLALATGIPADLSAWIDGRDYGALFAEAFGSPGVTAPRIAMAIATYERTQFSTQAPFDSVIAGTATLTPQEAAGMQLFGALPCARCHGGSLTSDNAFHYIGVRPVAEDSGRALVTHQLADAGAFKTPSLRNVALRPSFMHDGRFSTLAQVVDFYNRGGDFNAPNKSPLIAPLGLTPVQRAQLVAFLSRPLTDPRVAAEQAPFDRPALYGESSRVPVVIGAGVPGSGGATPQPVALEPPLRGNPSFTVGVHGALGGATAVLILDDAEPPLGAGIPATASFARLELSLNGSGDGAGWGSTTLAIPDDPALEGRTLHGRWYVADAGGEGGVAASPTFRFTIFGEHASDGSSVGVAPVAAAGLPRLATPQPNPFTDRSTVRFDLPVATRVELTVHDVTGRALRTLVRTPFSPPGAYLATWDGADAAGRRAPAGVYFVRLATAAGVRTARVVRIE